MNALAQLGMVSDIPSNNQISLSSSSEDVDCKDYFVEKDGMKFAGMHLLVDLWEATNLGDPAMIDRTLCAAALAAGATILHSHFHHFSPNGGVSGVVVLAESHISIHTWPENGYAALDIFMCGNATPDACVPVLRKAFSPKRIAVGEHLRGQGA